MQNLNEYRIQYYLGSLQNKRKIDKGLRHKLQTCGTYTLNCQSRSNACKNYVEPFKNLLQRSVGLRNYQTKRYIIHIGDLNDLYVRKHLPLLEYGFVKNRVERYNINGVILKTLNQNRHWGNVEQVGPLDISFSDKKNKAIWRGVTTGRSTYKANRFVLVKRWFHKNKWIDVGFNEILQNPVNYQEIFPNTTIEKYKRPSLSMKEMLQYKYIISVRGNDKDSGLNWKLASNSVVFMAKPTIITWLMESDLIPNFHYVLLKDDFSDLEEKVQWANRHPRIVQKISANARKFMSRFKNKTNEEKIETEVVRRYFSITENGQ
jgi:hypothetical protein